MRKLQEFEMFKRLMLDKYQEKLFSSLPKPNLTNLDIRDLADPAKLEKEKNKYSNDKTSVNGAGSKNDAKKLSPEKKRNTYNYSSKGLFYKDKDDELDRANRPGKNNTSSSRGSVTSESNSEPDSDDELRDAYNDLKTRQQTDEITKKLLKAFENTVMKVTENLHSENPLRP